MPPAPTSFPAEQHLRTLAPLLVDELRLLAARRNRLELFHDYYANPMSPVPVDPLELSDRFYRQAQERGLPLRITGQRLTSQHSLDPQRKEVVVENDIAWRIDTMVDVLLGRSPLIESTATDPQTRELLTGTLRATMEAAGGPSLLQELATQCAVYGFADLAVKPDPASPGGNTVRLEVIEPHTALPVVDPLCGRQLLAYARVIDLSATAAARLVLQAGNAASPLTGFDISELCGTGSQHRLLEIHFSGGWCRVLQGRLLDAGPSLTSGIPIVRFTNLPARNPWHPRGEVEPLIPMQDELNIRLSDRAYRTALTSAPMFLAAGIGDMPRVPLGPGRVWTTDNDKAKVMTFGGDPGVPSEDRHIDEVREALDKISGVSPIAAGAIKQKLGNLTSAAALRVTLQSLTTKTIRKRAAFAQGIATLARLTFETLAASGRLSVDPADWSTEVLWGPILPEDASEQLAQARAKLDLGLPARLVLKELGYELPDPAATSALSSVPNSVG
jgi:Phage portal protein, SPP1 Gp6-like